MPPESISKIKMEIVKFIWNGKQSKIACNILIQDIKNGGSKFKEISLKVICCFLSRIKRLVNPSVKGSWKNCFKHRNKLTNIYDTSLYYTTNKNQQPVL